MTERVASKIDADGMLVIPVTEIADAELDAVFEDKPEMQALVGAPMYWSPKHGYWPKPADGWRATP